jgi:ABC-type glycerol-3-phosphate transport system permease component
MTRDRRAWPRVALNATAGLAALVFCYPLVQMLVNAFKSNDEIVSNPGGLPRVWTLASFADLADPHRWLLRNLANAVLVAAGSTAFAVVLCAAAAFAFAKLRFRGSGLVFALLLATMMVPPEVVYPGQFILFSRLGLIDTLAVQVLPTITPVLGLFLMRQYMLSIPDELIDAARIDGAGLFTMFWRVIVPVSSPVLGAYAILHFLSTWNAYLWPTMVATRDAVKPIMVALPQLVDPTIGFLPIYGTIMAGCVAATIPLLLVFLRYRDKFMASVTVGAVK